MRAETPQGAAVLHVTLPLLAQLRAGTRAAHERMEANNAMSRLLSADLQSADYVYALRALHAFHAGIGARLMVLGQDLPDGCSFDTGRLALLGDDLAWFGAKPARHLSMARCITDTETAIGALYVLEGSALGARIIGKAVQASLDVEPARGGSFFCGATADGARERWITMSARINEAGAKMAAPARLRVVRGANAAFSALEHAIQRSAVAPTTASGLAMAHSPIDPASVNIVQPAATGQVMN